ncbi:hypothetical protein HK104_005304 [Borealophlyctis nickersoniae]|nr:hypothetical protein HK104_005304 [Borealophlyctis nickersoniae]
MDYSDIPKIRRQLRQLRAKLIALNGASQAAPTSLIKTPAPASASSFLTNRHSSSHDDDLFVPSGITDALRPPARVTFKGNRSRLSHNGSDARPAFSTMPSDQVEHLSDLASPVRRHALTLQDHFKDIVSKVWAQNSADCPSRSSSRGGSPTFTNVECNADGRRPAVLPLSTLAAFAVAKSAPDAAEEELGVDAEEEWYELMPLQSRTMILFEHIVQLCIQQVSIGSVVRGLVETCAEHSASVQGLELLQHLWDLRGIPSCQEYHWAIRLAHKLNLQTRWIHHICDTLTPARSEHLGFHTWLTTFDPHHPHAVLLTSTALETAVEAVEANRHYTNAMWTRVGIWIERLVEHSAKCDNLYTCPCARTIWKACGKKEVLSTCASELRACALLQALHLTVVIGSSTHLPESPLIDGWIADLSNISASASLECVTEIFSTVGRLRQIVRSLLRLNAFPVAIALMDVLVTGYDGLTEESLKEGEDLIGKDVLEAELADIQRSFEEFKKDATKWRYEPILDSWIVVTPRPLGKITKCRLTSPPPACAEESEDQMSSIRTTAIATSFVTPPPKRISRITFENDSPTDFLRRKRQLIDEEEEEEEDCDTRVPLSPLQAAHRRRSFPICRTSLAPTRTGKGGRGTDEDEMPTRGAPKGLEVEVIIEDEGKRKKRRVSSPRRRRAGSERSDEAMGEWGWGAAINLRVGKPLPLNWEVDELSM